MEEKKQPTTTLKGTNKEIAAFFGITEQTISNFKRSKDEKVRHRYLAYKKYFFEFHKIDPLKI